MTDHARLLHNMSVPSRTVIRYAGLPGMTKTAGHGAVAVAHAHDGVFGSFVAFRLPGETRGRSTASILEQIGENPGPDPERTLLELIEQRARDLPLPDGCAVKPCKPQHPCPWPDPLAALAIITKSSTNIWLRSKTPRLSTIRKRTAVSLLLLPAFAARLKELSE